MNKYITTACTAALLAGANAFAGSAAAPYDNSRIDARLNVTVKENTDVVHFVRDNADPNVITKTYQIKYVDPYELRTYLRKMVQTRKVNGDNTNVDAVTFTDGTSILLISAEDYRFNDTPNAQGFDSIVKTLDKPKLISRPGRNTYVYSPKYRSSQEVMNMVSLVGANEVDLTMGNPGGSDVLVNDPGLNLIFFTTAPFSHRTIMNVLNDYDKPYQQVRAKVTVYELYAENDTKLGLDFQAWKNNDGIDLFSAGGRFSRNHNGVELVNGAKFNKTTYFQFNPKWNTKYIDFLTSKGKAKVVHTSELTLRNNTPGVINKTTQVFAAKSTPADDIEYQAAYTSGTVANGSVVGKDFKGRDITINTVAYENPEVMEDEEFVAPADAMVTVSKAGKDDNLRYKLRLDKYGKTGFMINGKVVGKQVEAAMIAPALEASLNYRNIGHQRGNKINLEASDNFGFNIELTPSINTKATQLKVKIENSSLIGYTSNGSPRIQKGAVIDTDFMISNEGTKLVIGGIEKRSVVSVSGGIPILKDLPLLGWIFSTETEATKRSQLLVVAEVLPDTAADKHADTIKAVKDKLTEAGESNTFGYRQYLIDSDR